MPLPEMEGYRGMKGNSRIDKPVCILKESPLGLCPFSSQSVGNVAASCCVGTCPFAITYSAEFVQ